MKHRNCGGGLNRTKKTSSGNTYRCNRCGKTVATYKKDKTKK